MGSSTLGRNQLSATQLTPTQFTILAALPAVVSLRDVVQKDKATVVQSEEVVVEGEVRTEGQSLTILCRKLRFLEGASINADGKPADRSFTQDLRKEGPHDAGAAGADGDDGSDGFPGGVVDIQAEEVIGVVSISARGGAGGRGQDGGNGRTGPQGPGGQNGHGSLKKPPPQCYGGTGGQGGAVGLPGRSGRAGDGGKVRLKTLTALAAPSQIIVEPGPPGSIANPGTPAQGGPGGPGGAVSTRFCEPRERGPVFAPGDERLSLSRDETASSLKPLGFITLTDADTKDLTDSFAIDSLRRASASLASAYLMICFDDYLGDAPPGAQGPDGDRRIAEVAARQAPPAPAQPGTSDTQLVDKSAYASQFQGALLDLLASAIEDDYCSHGATVDDALRGRIEFLLQLCVEDPQPSPHKTEVMARAYSMARRIALGLDFFGYSLERAPLLSFEKYSELLKEGIIPNADLIEKSFITYWDARASAEAKRGAILTSRAEAGKRLTGLEKEYKFKREECGRALKELPNLDRKVEAAYGFLMTREAELTKAIKSKSQGCDLVKTLTAVATIVAGVGTGGAGFLAAASAGVKLYDDMRANDPMLDEIWDNRKVLGEDLKQIGKAGSTVAKAISDIADAVNSLTPEQRRLPQFRMEREQFDKVAREFADMPEAATYRDAGYDYLKCVETRNQAILDYNALLAQVIELQAKIAAAYRVNEALDSAMAATTDPSEAVIIPLMTRLYMDTLTLVAQMVHAERKALAYLLARPVDAPLSKLSLSTIVGVHEKTVEAWLYAKERYEARRQLEDGALQIDLSLVVSKIAWQAFIESGFLAFTLRRDHPEYSAILEALPGLRLTGMTLDLPGAKVNANIKVQQVGWNMNHAGYEAIYRADKSVTYFSHRSITFSGTSPLDGRPPIIRPDFSEKNLYAGVSPYASWLLTLLSNETLELDLRHLDGAVLRLSGYIMEG